MNPPFLNILSSVKNLEEVDLFAHSMGARLSTFAVDSLSKGSTTSIIRELVFAAPDVDVALFRQDLGAFKGVASRTTIYTSRFDTALMCSEGVHHNRRLGEGGDDVFVAPDIDTVDASEVERPPLMSWQAWIGTISCIGSGHGYYIDNLSVQEDLHELMSLGIEPARRHGLMQAHDQRYWVLKPVN